MGGDEFAVLVPGVASIEVLKDSMTTLLEAIRTPVVYENNTFTIDASIGISLFDGTSSSIEDIFRKADAAMYAAKKCTDHNIMCADK